jgi:hypothetical protein
MGCWHTDVKRDDKGEYIKGTGIYVVHLEDVIRLPAEELNGLLQALCLQEPRIAFTQPAGRYIKDHILEITKETRDLILPCLDQVSDIHKVWEIEVVDKKRMFKLFQKGE